MKRIAVHRWHKILAGLLVVAAGVTVPALRYQANQRADPVRFDFNHDYLSAKAWRTGGDPYAGTSENLFRGTGQRRGYEEFRPGGKNPHPPAAIVGVVPLTFLGMDTARNVWTILMLGLIVAGIWLVAREVGVTPGWALVAAVGCLALPPVPYDMRWAQSNGLMLFLFALAWVQMRRGREAVAGAVLGVAAAVKLFPALLLIPLVRQGRMRAAAWQVGSGVLISIAAGLAVGIGSTARFVTLSSPENLRFWRTAPWNISVVSVPYRWLTRGHWQPHSPDLPAVAALLALALAIGCVVAAGRTPARFTGDLFWASVPWMILASPLAWPHYMVMAIPVTIVAVARMPAVRPPIWALAGLALCFATPLVAAWRSALAQLLGLALPMYGLLLVGLADHWPGHHRERYSV